MEDLWKHLPGMAGVLLAALMRVKEGLRVMVTQAVAGICVVLALRGLTEWVSRKLDVPSDIIGFLIGGLGVGMFNKLAETVQQLEFAKPINAFIERWTGAKAPSSPPAPPPPVIVPPTEGQQP